MVAALAFHEIELRGDPEARRAERDRTRMNTLALLRLLRQLAAARIHPLMLDLAVNGVGAVRELRLHPLEIREPRTVHILVDHAHGDQRSFGRKLRESQRQFALLRHAVTPSSAYAAEYCKLGKEVFFFYGPVWRPANLPDQSLYSIAIRRIA
jgi:hypothetical protein